MFVFLTFRTRLQLWTVTTLQLWDFLAPKSYSTIKCGLGFYIFIGFGRTSQFYHININKISKLGLTLFYSDGQSMAFFLRLYLYILRLIVKCIINHFHLIWMLVSSRDYSILLIMLTLLIRIYPQNRTVPCRYPLQFLSRSWSLVAYYLP